MFNTFEFLSNGAAKNRSLGKQIGREQKSFVDLKSDDYEEQRMCDTTVAFLLFFTL